MKSTYLVLLVMSASCIPDRWCNATEKDGTISIRYLYQEESFARDCRDSGVEVAIWLVDGPPAQDQLRDVITQEPSQVAAIGDHEIEPGNYVMCPDRYGGGCTYAEVESGVVAVLRSFGPGGGGFETTQDESRYEFIAIE
jgi:hypothetical protein